MKALTFVSIILLAMSGTTARSVTAQPVEVAAATSQATQADLASQRICMRCLFGGKHDTRLKCGPDVPAFFSPAFQVWGSRAGQP